MIHRPPRPPLVVPQIIIIARFHQIIISCHWNKWTLADLAPADKYRSTLRSLIMQYSLYYLHVSSDIYRSSADQVWFIQFPVWALDHNWEAQLHSWTVAVKYRKIQKRFKQQRYIGGVGVIGPDPEVWLIRVLVALDCGEIALLQAIIPIIGASIAIIGAISATITIPIITSLPAGSYTWCPLLKNITRFHFDLFSFANHWKNRPHHKSLAPPILFHFMHQLHQKIAPAPSFYFALSGFFSLTISPASDLDHI